MGRGVARQKALEIASGELLAFVDADDWIYPSKLERQVATMERYPHLALLSSGMAVVNEGNSLIGVRLSLSNCYGVSTFGPITRLRQPEFAIPPSMIRMKIAKKIRFDESLMRAQDTDFAIRIIQNSKYGIVSEINYAYMAPYLPLDKRLMSLKFARKMYRKYRKSFPVTSRYNILKSSLKSILSIIIYGLGLENYFLARQNLLPTYEQVREFQAAREVVSKVVDRIFGLSD
jgi:glycosyltransferase involved in cell wall biosynthesis